MDCRHKEGVPTCTLFSIALSWNVRKKTERERLEGDSSSVVVCRSSMDTTGRGQHAVLSELSYPKD